MSGEIITATGDLFPAPGAVAKSIHATLDQAIAAIPDGHTHAFFVDGTYSAPDGPEGRVVFVQKAPDGWNIEADIGYDKPHGIGAGVRLMDSW